MWTHVHLNCHVVWNDVLWSVTAVWQDDAEEKPVVLEKSGRAPLSEGDGPDEVLIAAALALQRMALEGRAPVEGA